MTYQDVLETSTTQQREQPPAPPCDAAFPLGMHVTEVGEEVLQTSCGEFDSHRLQIFRTQVPRGLIENGSRRLIQSGC